MKNQKYKIIEINSDAFISHYWSEIWRHRELFIIFAIRDILVRYKQMAIGLAWVLIKPVLMMAIFTFVFGMVANLSSEGVPYALLVLTGLLPWQFFSSSLTESANSIISNTALISKIYLPRLIIPASTLAVNILDLLISFGLLFALMVWYGIFPSINIIFLPLILIFGLTFSLGAGVLLSALTVKYRDFRILIPFLLQLATYISPVAYSSSLIPEKWRFLYYINPIAGVIDGFRWSILGLKIYWPGVAISALVTIITLIIGIYFFRKNEKQFTDYI